MLAGAPGVEVCDLPTPLQAAGRDAALVGRIRGRTMPPIGWPCS